MSKRGKCDEARQDSKKCAKQRLQSKKGGLIMGVLFKKIMTKKEVYNLQSMAGVVVVDIVKEFYSGGRLFVVTWKDFA